ncbi:MAG: hypothetical protein GY863_15165 [bacterium]|nr:hypothetical protein [bacterium]
MLISADSITFDNVDDFAVFVRYNPKNSKSVPEGYVLAEDLVNEKGGILYAANSDMDAMKIGRLKKIQENNPEIKNKVVIKLSDRVNEIEREKIKAAAKRLIESKRSRMEYSKIMSLVQNMLDSRWNNILENNDLVLNISRLKFLEDRTKKSTISPFYNHVLNTLIFATGVMINMYYVNKEKSTAKEYTELGQAALLVDNGGWKNVGEHMEKPVEERQKQYYEANSTNSNDLKSMDLSEEVLDAIELCYKFNQGETEFFENESKASKYAQILCVARLFDEKVAGLWGDYKSPREVTDQLYLKTTAKELPKKYVDSLAKGLKFDNLFDFYHELELLVQSCMRNKSAPYPMKGFKSPVIFVCSKNLIDCKEFVASAKSITIFKDVQGLSAGSYGRCEGLSAKLALFYDDHYQEIKDDVLAKEAGRNKAGSEEEENAEPEQEEAKDKKEGNEEESAEPEQEEAEDKKEGNEEESAEPEQEEAEDKKEDGKEGEIGAVETEVKKEK